MRNGAEIAPRASPRAPSAPPAACRDTAQIGCFSHALTIASSPFLTAAKTAPAALRSSSGADESVRRRGRQDEARDAIGMEQGEVERHAAAEGMADQMRAIDLQVIEQPEQIVAARCTASRAAWTRRTDGCRSERRESRARTTGNSRSQLPRSMNAPCRKTTASPEPDVVASSRQEPEPRRCRACRRTIATMAAANLPIAVSSGLAHRAPPAPGTNAGTAHVSPSATSIRRSSEARRVLSRDDQLAGVGEKEHVGRRQQNRRVIALASFGCPSHRPVAASSATNWPFRLFENP